MPHTYFNSLDPACKTPFGAIPAGQEVTFRLTGPGRTGVRGPAPGTHQRPGGPRPLPHELRRPDAESHHFTFTIAPTTSGLYFYYFDLYTDFRKIYRGAGGEGVLSWTGGDCWQLTVYEPEFATPDWFRSGTMYQIFPDRFCEACPTSPCPLPTASTGRQDGGALFLAQRADDGYLNMDYYGGDFAGIRQKLPLSAGSGRDLLST